MVWQTPEVLILNTVSASAGVMLANSLINTYYGPIGSFSENRTYPRTAPQRREGETKEKTGGEEEDVSCADPDGQPNLPRGISLFWNPIFPMWLTRIESSKISLTLLATPIKD